MSRRRILLPIPTSVNELLVITKKPLAAFGKRAKIKPKKQKRKAKSGRKKNVGVNKSELTKTLKKVNIEGTKIEKSISLEIHLRKEIMKNQKLKTD
jgi:hypothetical protein